MPRRPLAAWPIAALVLAGPVLAGPATQPATSPASRPTSRPVENRMRTLRPGHPRLLVTGLADFDAVRELAKTDRWAVPWYHRLYNDGQKMLQAPVSRYEIPDGLRLLTTSRQVVSRVYTLAMLYRLDGDRRWADRAWAELEAAAAFPDWNPKHFLDTAEMTHAFAIGYDWLYDVWTADQRRTLREAIIRHGLEPALAAYEGRAESQKGWWVKAEHNWNQVCNGGVGMGALAIADEAPELANAVLDHAIQRLPAAMKHYAPDGAWDEGPAYWHYATRYNVAIIAALESALGTDFGLADIPGFDQAATFPIYMTGPTDRTFNYADGGDRVIVAPEMFWFARRFKQPHFARYELEHAVGSALDLLWYTALVRERGPLAATAPASRPTSQAATQPAVPLDKYFRGVEAVSFRSHWGNGYALFVAFKAGDNKANHSHLDLGSFVLDALGERWALDLGKEDYNLPGYWGPQRWTYYRLRAEGHNTLVIGHKPGPDQDPKAAAKIIRYRSKPEGALAVMDLSAAYGYPAGSVLRGVQMIERRKVMIQDEVSIPARQPVYWFMHTTAQVELSSDRQTAILALGRRGQEVRLALLAQRPFSVQPAAPLDTSPNPAGQTDNAGVQKLVLWLDERPRTARVPKGTATPDAASQPASQPAGQPASQPQHYRNCVLIVPLPEGEGQEMGEPSPWPAYLPLRQW